MKNILLLLLLFCACTSKDQVSAFYKNKDHFIFKLDIPSFKDLSLKEKLYIYYISKSSEAIEEIRRDQKNKAFYELFNFFNSIYENIEGTKEPLKNKIYSYLNKLKFFNSNYFEMKKIFPEFTYSELEAVCLTLEINKKYEACKRDLLILNAEIFDKKFKPTLISSSMYDPIRNSSINLYEEGISIFNLKTLRVKEEDRFSYFYKGTDGKLSKESFCSKYSLELKQIIENFAEAKKYSSQTQALILGFLIDFYKSCSFSKFTEYRIAWNYEDKLSLLNGFVEKIYDPVKERGLMSNLLFSKTKESSVFKRYVLFNTLGFFDGQNMMYAVLPEDFNMVSYGSNRLINAINVTAPILTYFNKNILSEYYPPKYKKDLDLGNTLRFKIEEIKDRFIHNILIDKKNESLINVKYPFLNELNAYAKAIIFVLENNTFEYMSIKNSSQLAVYAFLTEAVVFSLVFENFNEAATLLVKYLTNNGSLVFYNEASKYYFEFEKEKLIEQLKFLVMDLDVLNSSEDLKELEYYYQEKLAKKFLSSLIRTNYNARYEGLSNSAKYFNFINPRFSLLEKDNEIIDVTYNYKIY